MEALWKGGCGSQQHELTLLCHFALLCAWQPAGERADRRLRRIVEGSLRFSKVDRLVFPLHATWCDAHSPATRKEGRGLCGPRCPARRDWSRTSEIRVPRDPTHCPDAD